MRACPGDQPSGWTQCQAGQQLSYVQPHRQGYQKGVVMVISLKNLGVEQRSPSTMSQQLSFCGYL